MRRKSKHVRRPHVAKQVGLARYQREHWPQWLAAVADREDFLDTFEEWRRGAEAMAGRLRAAGFTVVWVDLEPAAFAAWCQSRGIANDAEARSRFAAEAIGNLPRPETPGSRSAKGPSLVE